MTTPSQPTVLERASAKRKKPLLARVPADFVRAVLKGHSALGLAFAAAIYLVCLSGSLAVFAHEFQRWELAGLPRVEVLSAEAAQRALAEAVRRGGAGVEHVYITPPSADLPQATVHVEGTAGKESTWLADAEGRIAARADMPWTEFITRLHIHLHLPQVWGMFLVGLTGVALLSSLISGILAHPRILRDAFHLRLGGARRLQEADLHNRIGVWALPFHVLVSLSGAVLGLTTLIVGVLGMALFQGDTAKVYALFIAQEPREDPRPAPVIDLRPMFAQVERLAPGGQVSLVMLEHPTEMGAAALFYVDRGGRRLADRDSFAFERGGRLYHEKRAADANLGESILGSIGKLHFGWFGGYLVKIAYALLGLGLTYLAAGGVTIWLARRRDKRNPAPGLERLWAATLWGQPAALAGAALTALLAPSAGTMVPLATWGAVTLVGLASAVRLSVFAIRRIGRVFTGALLLATATIHAGTIGGTDPVAWTIDGVLVLSGAALLFARRRSRPAP
ncbi:MAG TPA: PepSY-associated TM helix domain-containing protein [Novosphingobium sp.]|nr:PepSY-associated TM helix domain-containing protein [Novosphingobium sp.]